MDKITIDIFTNAGKHHANLQLGFVGGLLFDNLKLDSVFYTVTWSSHLSKQPTRSIGAPLIIAAVEAIDEGKSICPTCKKLIQVDIKLVKDWIQRICSLPCPLRATVQTDQYVQVSIVHDLSSRHETFITSFGFLVSRIHLTYVRKLTVHSLKF